MGAEEINEIVSAIKLVLTNWSISDKVYSVSPVGSSLSSKTLRLGFAFTSMSHNCQLSSIKMSRPKI